MNEIVKNLTLENFLNLRSSFDNSKILFSSSTNEKLVHPGEYGIYREELVKRWLKMYIPERLGISSGFVITSTNKISTQCDIIIYDKFNTPKIENNGDQRFFPVETVIAVGEVKSDINSALELNKHLLKLSNIKRLRDEVQDPQMVLNPFLNIIHRNESYAPTIYPTQSIFTFLICNKFKFQFNTDSIQYNGVELKNKHNMILSLNDGLCCYLDDDNCHIPYPFIKQKTFPDFFLENLQDETLPLSVTSFLGYLKGALDSIPVMHLEMMYYLKDNR